MAQLGALDCSATMPGRLQPEGRASSYDTGTPCLLDLALIVESQLCLGYQYRTCSMLARTNMSDVMARIQANCSNRDLPLRVLFNHALFGECRFASLRSLLPAYACHLMVALASFAHSQSVRRGSSEVCPRVGWGFDKGLGMHLEVDALDLHQRDEIDHSHARVGPYGKLFELLVGAEPESSVRNDLDCVRPRKRPRLSSSFLPQSPKSPTCLCRAAGIAHRNFAQS